MKNMTILFVGIAALVCAEATAKIDESKLTPEQRTRLEATRMRTGGMILDTRNQKGKVVIYNGQKTVSDKAIADVAKELAEYLKVRVEVSNGPSAAFGESRKIKDSTKACALVVVSDKEAEAGFLVDPDAAISFINVRTLAGGNVEKRVQTQIRRAFNYACGCGSCNGYMARMKEAADLEKTGEDYQLPYSMEQTISEFLKGVGVTSGKNVPYIKACMEGWAPKPVNKYQQAAWDKARNNKMDAADPTNRWKRDFEKK